MLSKVLLHYADDDLVRRFKYSRQDFYRKALPLIAILILALAIALEVIDRVKNMGNSEMFLVTSIFNWVFFAIFVVLSCLIRKWAWPGALVCPLLTIIVYYYFAFVDYQDSPAILYFT